MKGKLFIYYKNDLVAEHELAKPCSINYQGDHYKKGLIGKLKNDDEIEKILKEKMENYLNKKTE